MALKVGDTIVLNAEETTQYPPEWQGRRMTVTFIATSVKDHPGYDGDAAAGSPLVDCCFQDTGEPVPNSFYDWEFIIV